jgi:hypothetical protein
MLRARRARARTPMIVDVLAVEYPAIRWGPAGSLGVLLVWV